MDFIFNEVIPAFGGWEAILSEFPEVELSLILEGVKISIPLSSPAKKINLKFWLV